MNELAGHLWTVWDVPTEEGSVKFLCAYCQISISVVRDNFSYRKSRHPTNSELLGKSLPTRCKEATVSEVMES